MSSTLDPMISVASTDATEALNATDLLEATLFPSTTAPGQLTTTPLPNSRRHAELTLFGLPIAVIVPILAFVSVPLIFVFVCAVSACARSCREKPRVHLDPSSFNFAAPRLKTSLSQHPLNHHQSSSSSPPISTIVNSSSNTRPPGNAFNSPSGSSLISLDTTCTHTSNFSKRSHQTDAAPRPPGGKRRSNKVMPLMDRKVSSDAGSSDPGHPGRPKQDSFSHTTSSDESPLPSDVANLESVKSSAAASTSSYKTYRYIANANGTKNRRYQPDNKPNSRSRTPSRSRGSQSAHFVISMGDILQSEEMSEAKV